MKELFPKWIALGGGGYEITNVAKAWTLAWAIMNGVQIPDELPGDFVALYPMEGFCSGKVRDDVYRETGREKEMMLGEVEREVKFLREKVLTRSGTAADADAER
jgi:acetoin utilization protein AcuC